MRLMAAVTATTCVLATIVFCANTVFAQAPTKAPSSQEKARAQSLYKQSKEASAAGDFRRGAQLMMDAYDVLPDPAFLSLAADALRSANKYPDALSRFCEYLSKAKSGPLAPHATQQAKELHELLGRDVADANVCDVAELAKTLKPTEKSNDETSAEVVDPVKKTPIETAGTISESEPSNTVALVVGAGGLVGLGVGSYFAYEGARIRDKNDLALKDQGERANTFAYAGFIVGGALVITAVVLTIRNRKSHPSPAVGAAVSSNGAVLVVSGHF
jgi:hypothetical protein